ncbi:MAG: hypothetical protein PHG04_04520 [Candidatus Nanoarchaeia archaeon]|nr:hypothetical protein [Candidatus Nanoarchaeia archaeon]MDD5054607.1 hypothetical protein [Candidatus Nanoarchaeia archaeon]
MIEYILTIILFYMKAATVILALFSLFKWLEKREIPELSELEFFLQVNIKDYLIKTFDIEQVKKILKMDEKEFSKKNNKKLLKNVMIAKSLIKEYNKKKIQ